MVQGSIPNSYNNPSAVISLFCRTFETPKFLFYPAAASHFVMPPKRYRQILGLPTLATNLLCPNTLPPNFVISQGSMPALTLTGHLWIFLIPFSELIIAK
jgi:hypothetical protein